MVKVNFSGSSLSRSRALGDWRAGPDGAVQRGVVTAQDARGRAHRRPLGEESLPERDLLGAQRGRTAEAHALLLRGAASGVGAFGDERALELRIMRSTA